MLVDQHAAHERVRLERLQSGTYMNTLKIMFFKCGLWVCINIIHVYKEIHSALLFALLLLTLFLGPINTIGDHLS